MEFMEFMEEIQNNTKNLYSFKYFTEKLTKKGL